MLEVTYDEARSFIKNGDIIQIYYPSSLRKWNLGNFFVYPLIHLFTGSQIYHCGVAIWVTTPGGTRRLMLVESSFNGGKRIVPLSLYKGYRMEVHSLPPNISFSGMEEILMRRVGSQSYGILDFLSIGLKEFLKLDIKKNFTGQVCSELCADAWMKVGIPLSSSLVSPGKLRRMLTRLDIPPTIKISE